MSTKIERYDAIDLKNIEPIEFSYNPPDNFNQIIEKPRLFDVELDEKLKASGKPHRIIKKYRLIND